MANYTQDLGADVIYDAYDALVALNIACVAGCL